MFNKRFCLFFAVLLVSVTASAVAENVPIGFQILGAKVPASAENVPIPDGFTEKLPETNRFLPELSENEKEKGYVVFVKNYLEPIYPRTRPLREEITSNLSIFSAPGEYEPVTFAIFALKNIEKVRIVVDDLKSPDGNTIKTSNIDVRIVRCMPRRVWAKPAYVVRPTLLEKRPETNINKDSTRQFWITVYVPANSAAGQYFGTIRIIAKGLEESSLKLQLKVLPIKLLKTPTHQGMYCNFVDIGTAPMFKSLPPESIRKDIINMKEHGMNTIFLSIPPRCNSFKKAGKVRFSLEPLRPLMETCQQTGISTVIYNVVLDEIINNPLGDFQTMIMALMEGFSEMGWQELILSAGDEADANKTLPAVMSKLEVLKKSFPQILTYETIVFPENSEVFEPYLDIRAFSSYMDETVVEPTRKAGRQLWIYSGTSGYGIDPKGDRLCRGICAAKLGLDGALDWTYWRPAIDFNQPFNDLFPASDRNNMTCWVFPGEDGPLPSPGWEALREGIEDEKYIFTLNILIQKARKTKSKKLITLAQDAEKHLKKAYDQVDTSPRPDNNTFPMRLAADKLTADFFNEFRYGVAEYIIKLGKDLNSQ